VTIASYSKPKAVKFLMMILAVVIFIFGTSLWLSGGVIGPAPTPLKFGFGIQVIAWLCGLWGLWFVGVLLRQITMNNGRAIWIENGRIVHLHKWHQAADAKDVKDIVAANSGALARPVIVLRLRNGRTIEIQANLFSEPNDVIAARLKCLAGVGGAMSCVPE
jgi:hypothetical protein